MRKDIFNILFVLVLLGTSIRVHGAETFVVFNPSAATTALNDATLLPLAENEHPCVKRAVEALRGDWQKVTGQQLATASNADGAVQILVGTVGKNSEIDRLVKSGVLTNLKGKTEKYIIKTIGNRLVIAGSDKRGTAFGVYEMCQQLGVSPWHFWADVPVEKHTNIYIKQGEYSDGEPAVRYRGIFLNDEAPCLTSWVKNTFGTDYGDHRFYKHVFDLILRLKGNFLWPAMWGWAFYADDAENSRLADEMGVIIGTSHHEPMARNHQEWARHRNEYGAWNYQTNQAVIDRFFREGIERIKGTDDIVTIGMRGDGDEAMSEDADTKLLQRIVENQRKIIKDVTGRPAKETPQMWALYKEVLDYYDKGMRVPDDVLILLCDDNWGNLRRVPNAKELNHPGGWGLYYHVDYVGAPRNSKWLNVTPSQNMWEQLTLAADYGLDRMWILNVGDLKPMEYPITLFLDMAWNPRSISTDVVGTHTEPFCCKMFGENQAAEAARILNQCCRLNGRSTAEMLDATTYNLASGEWKQVADEYMRLEAEALRQYLTIDDSHRDTYKQLILFPVQAMSNIHQMYYAQAMNLQLAADGNPDANIWAQRVEEAFKRDSMLCADYNKNISNGKWNGMMTQKHIGYTSWNDDFPRDIMPKTKTIEDGEGGYTFIAQNGYVAMEAEHYYDCAAQDDAKWAVIPYMGRTRSAMTLMPYTAVPESNACLNYRFQMNGKAPERVKIHVIVKSTLDYLNKGGLTYTVSLDGAEPQTICFNDRLNEQKENIYSVFYPTVARRIVESVIEVPFDGSKALHTLTLHPNDPAIVFEKIVIDAGGYQPSFLFGTESPLTRARQ